MKALLLPLALLFALPNPARAEFDARGGGAWRIAQFLPCAEVEPGDPTPIRRECDSAQHTESIVIMPEYMTLPGRSSLCEAPFYSIGVKDTRMIQDWLPERLTINFSGNFVFAGSIQCRDSDDIQRLIVDKNMAILMSEDDQVILLTRYSNF